MRSFPFGDASGGLVDARFDPFRLSKHDQTSSEGHLAVLSHIATLPQMVYPVVFATVGDWAPKPPEITAKQGNLGSGNGTAFGSSPCIAADWRFESSHGHDASNTRLVSPPVQYLPSLVLNAATQPLYVSRVTGTPLSRAYRCLVRGTTVVVFIVDVMLSAVDGSVMIHPEGSSPLRSSTGFGDSSVPAYFQSHNPGRPPGYEHYNHHGLTSGGVSLSSQWVPNEPVKPQKARKHARSANDVVSKPSTQPSAVKKPRKTVYTCTECGQPKKGHKCPYAWPNVKYPY
jgi:hypothetical protein